MVIKGTPVFTKQVQKLLDRESYRLLQLRLVAEPDAGDLIRGTGGSRMIRWEGAGRGKRGGVRVIWQHCVELAKRGHEAVYGVPSGPEEMPWLPGRVPVVINR